MAVDQPDCCVSGSLASGLGVINESLASARKMPGSSNKCGSIYHLHYITGELGGDYSWHWGHEQTFQGFRASNFERASPCALSLSLSLSRPTGLAGPPTVWNISLVLTAPLSV